MGGLEWLFASVLHWSKPTTHSSLVIGASLLYFPFILMVKLVPVVKLIRTFALCEVGRVLEGYIASPVHQAHWDHLEASH